MNSRFIRRDYVHNRTGGDVVNIPAGVKHWHGAASDSWFSHLAVEVPGEEASNEWLEPVDDEQYLKATDKKA